MWGEVGNLLQKQVVWEGENIPKVCDAWWLQHPRGNLPNLPPIICWGIWITRNRCIFFDKETPVESIGIQCTSTFTNIPESEEERRPRQIREEQIKEGIPSAFFDGASQNNKAGAVLIIHLNKNQTLNSSVGLGNGTNNFAKMSALKLLLCWLIHRNIFTVQIFQDSLNVINWVNGQSRCQNYILRPLLEEILNLKLSFIVFSLCHIYRERNNSGDKLSKEGLQQDLGSWSIVEEDNGLIHVSDQPPHS